MPRGDLPNHTSGKTWEIRGRTPDFCIPGGGMAWLYGHSGHPFVRFESFLGCRGKRRGSRALTISCDNERPVLPLIGGSPLYWTQDAAFQGGAGQDLPGLCRNFPLHPMISHGIPNSRRMTTGSEKQGRLQDPEQAKAGFIQAPVFIRTQRSGARASRHLPQVARVAGRPAMGQAADRAVAAARSAVSVSGPGFPGRGLTEATKAAQGGRKADVGGVQRRVHPEGGR